MQPEARARIIVRISWLTGRGQQSDSYIAGSNHAMTLARMRVASLLLGRCPQTRALLAFSRRDVSADLTWRARRRIAKYSPYARETRKGRIDPILDEGGVEDKTRPLHNAKRLARGRGGNTSEELPLVVRAAVSRELRAEAI